MSDKKHFGLQTFFTRNLLLYLFLIGIFYAATTDGLLLQPSKRESKFPQTITHSWIPSSFPTASALNISQKCISDTQDYVIAFLTKRPWAVKSKLTLYNNCSYATCLSDQTAWLLSVRIVWTIGGRIDSHWQRQRAPWIRIIWRMSICPIGWHRLSRAVLLRVLRSKADSAEWKRNGQQFRRGRTLHVHVKFSNAEH